MTPNDAVRVLDDLMDALDDKVAQQRETGGGDAIDAVLAGRGRATRVTSVREFEAVGAFRQALADGMVEADTANQLLRLLNELILRLG